MFERFTRNTAVASGAALLAALGVGTAAMAQSSGSQPTPPAQSQAKEVPGQESNAPENSATDKDNVQYTAPGDADYKGSSSTRAKATAASTTPAEAPGTEQPAASEAPGAAEAPGSESATASDGPGGHADEPGNANADHQFQGVE
jgi:hypothetical protein